MLSAEEYERYQCFKAVSEFGQELDPITFRQKRKEKFLEWLPELLAPYHRICDYGAGTGWLSELCSEMGKVCFNVDEIGAKHGSVRSSRSIW